MTIGNIPKGTRKVHIGDAVFHYMIGKQFIPIWLPSGKKHLGDWSKITGLTWDALERSKLGGKYDHPITPADVKDYIIKYKLHEEE